MIKYIFPIVLCIIPLSGSAQRNSRIESEIRRLEQIGVEGILTADSNALKKIWALEFMVTTPRNDIAKNRDAVFQNQKKGFINYTSFERVIEEIRIHKNVVITMGHEVFVPKVDLPDGKAGEAVKRRFTNIWMRKNGEWKQVARHASIICAS